MERTGKLADLKLVNKYYPPVSNYSYPRTEIGTRHERPVGRSSVGSDCSAPGMTDDQESDISVEDANQYHLAGDELWDTFWEDAESFCGSSQVVEEEGQGAAVVSRGARYPALIPSPVAQRKAHRGLPWDDRRAALQAQKQDGADQDAAIRCWPLAAAERPVTPGSKPVKASYSLFPHPKPTPVLNLTPRRPARPPRSGFLWEAQPHDPSAVSQTTSSLGRSTRPKKLHLPTSDGAISYNSSSSTSHTHSAPVSPTIPSPMQSAATILRRSEPNSLAQPRQMILTRICSDTTDLYSMTTNTASQETLTAPTIPPRSPQRRQGRHSRQHSQLRNSITTEELDSEPAQGVQKSPSTITGTSQTSSSSSSSRETAQQWPTTPPSPQRPPPPPPLPLPLPQSTPRQQPQQQKQQPQPPELALPLPVSFFELDSDSDSDSGDVTLARRIVRGLTPHKRTRSSAAAAAAAAATSRSRKGGDLAREQLRRARAVTTTTVTTTSPPGTII
ncbi:hypothetical protein VPNG_04577 [Cytospora leucostoma]|uniref:Uncharacterized protein n=1 Tax=Cytospora leucostoma TaxID=1230097 RepID=A0A423XCD2_9PEZI|nr:hypothetical protein VPNG_04577 [Cytospora leucostoma]